MGKNSKFKRKSKQDVLTNEKIKNNTEKIGFFVKTTKKEDKMQRLEKNKNKLTLIFIK